LERDGKGTLFETKPLFLLDNNLWPEASDSIDLPVHIPYVRTEMNKEKSPEPYNSKTLKLIVQAKTTQKGDFVIDMEGKMQGYEAEKRQTIVSWWAPFLIGEKFPKKNEWIRWDSFVDPFNFPPLNCPPGMHYYILGIHYPIIAVEL
jgi:hypothetical protein